MRTLRSVSLRSLVSSSTLAFAFAGALVARDAHAETACGSRAAGWNAPRGALVVEESGDSPVGKLLSAIHETYSHSMLSHGPSGMSHATRNSSPKQVNECSTIFDADDLKKGMPGAERIDIGATYAFIYGDDELAAHSSAPPLYYDAVVPGQWVPGECKNPKRVGDDGTSFTCDPIPGCGNPRVSGGAVVCDPIPACTSNPIVRGNLIFCDAAASGCATGGHLVTDDGHFECQSMLTTQYCDYWIGKNCSLHENDCDDGEGGFRGRGGRCGHWSTRTSDPEASLRAYPPYVDSQLVSSGESPRGAAIAESLERQGTWNGKYFEYGLPYDFYQFMNIQGTHYGITQPGEGVVCSTLLAKAQYEATGTVVQPFLYDHDEMVDAANALFNAIHDKCESQVGFIDKGEWALQCGDFSVSPCTIAARQVVNCFATGNCGDSSSETFNSIRDNPSSQPWSVSPDRLAGIGRHGAPNEKTDVHTSPTSIWARDDGHPVTFSGPGTVYSCWE